MNIIVAADKNWGIGRNNELLVSIPADMKMFREETTGKVVVMGRKTLESFPNGLPLKNRTNIVITGNRDYQVKGAVIVHSIEEALKEVEKYPAVCADDFRVKFFGESDSHSGFSGSGGSEDGDEFWKLGHGEWGCDEYIIRYSEVLSIP